MLGGCIPSEVFTKAVSGARLSTARKKGFLLRSLTYCCLLTAAFGLSVGGLRADVIQLAQGSGLTVDFAMPGFNPSNPGALFPTTIGLELVGSVPSGSATASIPGSSQSYFTGILAQASLESLDGSVSLPLFDADSWRLGFSTGTLVADSTGSNTFVIFAQVAVSLNASEAIFGTTGQAQFVVQNLGNAFTIGLGPGYSLSNAILAPLTANNGSVETAGYVQSMEMTAPLLGTSSVSVPEPATLGAAAAAGALLFWLRRWLRP
jgi:hypothetical protein